MKADLGMHGSEWKGAGKEQGQAAQQRALEGTALSPEPAMPAPQSQTSSYRNHAQQTSGT